MTVERHKKLRHSYAPVFFQKNFGSALRRVVIVFRAEQTLRGCGDAAEQVLLVV